MLDLFAEIQDPRERTVSEALWTAEYHSSPEKIAAVRGEDHARRLVQRALKLRVRPFLAMIDATQAVQGP